MGVAARPSSRFEAGRFTLAAYLIQLLSRPLPRLRNAETSLAINFFRLKGLMSSKPSAIKDPIVAAARVLMLMPALPSRPRTRLSCERQPSRSVAMFIQSADGREIAGPGSPDLGETDLWN